MVVVVVIVIIIIVIIIDTDVELRRVSEGTLEGPAGAIQGYEPGLHHPECVHDGCGERDCVGGDEPAPEASGSGVVAALRRAWCGTRCGVCGEGGGRWSSLQVVGAGRCPPNDAVVEWGRERLSVPGLVNDFHAPNRIVAAVHGSRLSAGGVGAAVAGNAEPFWSGVHQMGSVGGDTARHVSAGCM